MNDVERLSWDVVEARLAAGAFAILPIGAGAKQHGFHLPMGTDRIQAHWLAHRLAERFDALVWPVLTYGYYPAFVAYAGSVSLAAETFEATVGDLTRALLMEADRVAILNTGISTIAPVERATAELGPDVLHLKIHEGRRYGETAARLMVQRHGGHADELETSRMLALDPDAVAMERAQPGPETPPIPGPMQRTDPHAPNYSRSGSIGDPRGATPEKGHALLAAMVEDMVAAVSDWLARPV